MYEWYNGLQRDRNHYEPMWPQTKALLDGLFCDHNVDLAELLNGQLGLTGPDGTEPLLLPKHGYACVE